MSAVLIPPSGSGGTFNGTGSPQGVVVASPGQFYWDTAAHQMWVKDSGTNTNTGWLLVLA